MAEENKENEVKKPRKTKSQAIGHQAKAVVANNRPQLDIDTNKILADNIIEASQFGGLNTSELEAFTQVANSRDQVYQLIDTMTMDSSVSSIVRTISEDVCEMADNGHIIWAESSDSKISKFVNYLLNVMNVDKNIFKWTYCLVKYGDVYLRLYRESDYKDELFHAKNMQNAYSARNVLNESAKSEMNESLNLHMSRQDDPYSYYVEMVADPSTMFELTKYGRTYGYIEVPNGKTPLGFTAALTQGTTDMSGGQQPIYNYRMRSNDVNIYQADDFVHACLEDNYSRFPETVDIFLTDDVDSTAQSYSVRRGKSMLYDSYKIWRQKQLLEASVLLNRITRSSIFRDVAVEVGDMPKEKVGEVLRRVKDMFEQKTSFNAGASMAESTNPGPIENFIFHAVHNGQGGITVNSVGGDINVKDLADLDWWNNKFYSSYGIPKQYFGWTDDGAGFNGGSALTVLSSVYSKSVKRIQNSIIQAITDIINLILVSKGYVSYLNNFEIKMRAPLTQEEISYRENLSNKINALSNFNSLLTDVEDKARRLEILKILLKTLNYGDEITAEVDKEIKAVNEAKKKAEAEAAAEEAAAAESGGDTGGEDAGGAMDLDLDAGMDDSAESTESAEAPDMDSVELPPMPESFMTNGGATTLVEGPDFLTEDDDLPSPEEADASIDFTENN